MNAILAVNGRSNIPVHEDHRKSPYSCKDVGMGEVIKELRNSSETSLL